MTQWSEIYDSVCDVLLESGGLQLALLTDGQFLQIAGEVLTDFLGKTSLIKKLFNIPALVGIPTYNEPSEVGEVESVNVEQSYCYRTSGYYLDNENPDRASFGGSPASWREDELTPETIQIVPAPNVKGNQVSVPAGQGWYGTISSTSNPVDFDVQMSTGQEGYGTISAIGGSPYVEVIGPGFGVISSLVASTNNVQMLASALPTNIVGIKLTDYVEMLPDSFTPYLKYGILARVFSSDSELKDSAKSAYCVSRYQEGITLGKFLMSVESA